MLRDVVPGTVSTGIHEAAEGTLAGAEAADAAAGQALRFGPYGGPSARGQLPQLMRAAVAVTQAQQVRFRIWSTITLNWLASQTMLTATVACSLGCRSVCAAIRLSCLCGGPQAIDLEHALSQPPST